VRGPERAVDGRGKNRVRFAVGLCNIARRIRDSMSVLIAVKNDKCNEQLVGL